MRCAGSVDRTSNRLERAATGAARLRFLREPAICPNWDAWRFDDGANSLRQGRIRRKNLERKARFDARRRQFVVECRSW
jgi:hypothetical protein